MARRHLGVFLVLAIGCGPIDEPSVDPKEDGDVIDAPRIPEGFASGVNFAPPTNQRTGLVQLDGNSLVDDQGKFNALGATMMWAA
ncbi:MAG TPA: hypothetical protein VFB62_08315, partial [Polyangiaceae bacterium]|nr:hypothetical protein [Polyangiaceae bacterium]